MTRNEFSTWLRSAPRRPLVMGVLNLTPDSFSDGGRFLSPEASIAYAEHLIDEGADLLDIGGESTRPGSQPVPADAQIARIMPVLKAVASRFPIAISIDTTASQAAAAALDAGAAIVNDISAGRFDLEMLTLVARRRCPIILMHMQGTPATMQDCPVYQDVVAEVAAFFKERLLAATNAGIDPSLTFLDPGLGFGKTAAHNLELLRRIKELLDLARPLMIGASRKGFIGTITGEPKPDQRLAGTLATTVWSIANGASIVRVHDVRANVAAIRMLESIIGQSP
jgi:dihydropteroate synthase